MSNCNSCSTSSPGEILIFACSGAADVGAVADQAARQLSQNGDGQMFCLAGVGGKVDPIVQRTQAAAVVLAIDGCPVNCVLKTLEAAGISGARHLRLADLDLVKGKTPPNAENVAKAVAAAKAILVQP